MKPTKKELRQILHDKYMAYDKEKLVGYIVDITMGTYMPNYLFVKISTK